MNKSVTQITNKPFVRNVLIMVTGTTAAQIVNLLLQPIITRIYGPEAYGLMGVFMAIVGVIIPIVALTFPFAIVLPKSDAEAKRLIKLSLYITGIVALIIGLIIVIFNELIITLFQIEDIASFLYLIPLVVIFSGVLQVTEQWLIRTKQFKITAKVAFLQSLVLNGSKVGIGSFAPVAGALVILSAFSNGLKAIMLIFFNRKSSYKSEDNEASKDALSTLVKKYRDFPIFRAPQAFVHAFTLSLPLLLLTSFFGPISAGYYSLGKSVMSLPTQLIGKSVGDVFYARVAEANNSGENFTKLLYKATFGLVLVALIPFGAIIAFGPFIFSLIFGEEWFRAGEYARWIAVSVGFSFISQPAIKTLPILKAQAFHLKFTIITLVTNILSLTLGYYLFSSDLIAIILYSVTSAAASFCLIIITVYLTKKKHNTSRL